MSELHISPTLSLPIDAVTQKFGVLGRTGSGKSYAATKAAEEMLDAKAQIVVLDPVGVWWGLRVSKNGKNEAFKIPVLGGMHGDIPLEPGAGALIADLIVDREISAVVDVSGFLLSDQRRFATDFAMQLFHRKKSHRSALHLFVEEAQEFVPQHVRGDVAKMVGAYERLLKLGRNFGIGATLISQRPQSVNKDVLNQTECLLAFQMTGPQERKAIAGWIAEKGLDADIVNELPKLKVGECYIWSPQWLEISEKIKIAPKNTADVSSTPKPGVKPIEPKQLSQIELENLSDKMLATIERAKADDPKELRRKIAELDRERREMLVHLDKNSSQKVEIKTVEKPVLKDGQLARAEKIVDRLEKFRDQFAGELDDALKPINEALIRLREHDPAVRPLFDSRGQHVANVHRQVKPAQIQRPPPARQVNPAQVGDGDFKISATQQRILDALAWLESIGNPTPTTLQVGAIALIDATGGHFSNTVGPLSTNGLVVRGNGVLSLTDEGRKFARMPEKVSSLADYHEMLRQRVRRARSAGGKTVEMLDVIIEKGGAELTAEEIGAAVNIDHTGGHFSNTIGPLGTLGLIQRSHGVIRPTEIIFPPGLI